MPTLHWIGKEKVINHHREVPYRVLEKQYTFSAGDDARSSGRDVSSSISEAALRRTQGVRGAENMIIQGDNLEALKSLLPRYEGKVKCIYIDPPYNTGNEGWVYNDNVNDPRIKKWLGEVVGKEGEDLSRHDKWLCMMYPRLVLLHRLLAEDGLIFINLDDNETYNCKSILDEIFGSANYLACIAWEKRYTRSNNAKRFYSLKDSILVYRRSAFLEKVKEGRTIKADSAYTNPDNDARGPWMTSSYVNPATREKRKNLVYPIVRPVNGELVNHPTHAWKYSPSEHERHVNENRLWWGADGLAKYPRLKLYLNEKDEGMVPVDLWKYDEVGTTDDGSIMLKEIFENSVFDNPKPPSLIEKVLSLIPDSNALILDSFAGSGTTAHAVLNLNKQDGGHRQFILIEMMDYADSITAERVKRVMKGYGQGDKAVEGTGGSFDFYTLGVPLFTDGNLLNEEVGVERIREYIWFTETRSTAPAMALDAAPNPYYLGRHQDTAYYFVYEKEDLTTLDHDLLATLPAKGERTVIYADNCLLPKKFMEQHGIVFKKIPRDITRF
ncbi:MAG TPA: site-specific DNA-methyltransferase [Flavobacteriales bacterium]|nr:site-specific DNA-methyltransferase [Flavobacteriales bacterium]